MGDRLKTRIKYVFTINELYSIVVALLPVISIYKVPVLNVGFSTFFLCLFSVYVIWYISKNIKPVEPFFVPTIVFIIYMLLRSFQTPLYVVVFAIVLLNVVGAFDGCLNFCVCIKVIEKVSLLASILVILQTILYYVFGVKFTFLIEPLMLDANKISYYSFYQRSGLYRPSAFFLEPSHMAAYSVVVLWSLLFSSQEDRIKKQKVVIVLLGIVLTTSGIGVVLCFLLILASRLRSGKSLGHNGIRVMETVVSILFTLAVAFLLTKIPFIRAIIARFANFDGGEANAINGRVGNWSVTVAKLKGKELLLGKGTMNTEYYVTGFMRIIYGYGLVGIVLFLATVLTYIIRSRNYSVMCLVVMFLGITFFADTTNLPNMTFWLCILITAVFYGPVPSGKENQVTG